MTWVKSVKPTPEQISPYVHWWSERDGKPLLDQVGDRQLLTTTRIVSAFVRQSEAFQLEPTSDKEKGTADSLVEGLYSGGVSVPIPASANNPDFQGASARPSQELVDQLPDDVDDDTVIVGIIDTGIALGHRRLCRRNGKTRFIASWQQTADWIPDTGQTYLPFGEELYSAEIDALLDAHRVGSWLDEDTFNRDAKIVEPKKIFGQRDLDYGAAHGAHVLDLASGYDPNTADPELTEKLRIVAVNLPTQSLHGSAGNFLAYFAVHALEHILKVADALWIKNNPDPKKGVAMGYPVVINFSYGMQAGPKDGSLPLAKAFDQIRKFRAEKTGFTSPVRYVLPAGNNNLSRAAASIVMGPDGTKSGNNVLQSTISIPWRVQPADTTSNYVEVWTQALRQDEPEADPGLRLCVTPPGQEALQVPFLKSGEFANLGDAARVYCERKDLTDETTRFCFTICAAPTLNYSGDVATAPAGLWKIEAEYTREEPMDVAFYVQSDQSIVRDKTTAHLSYFDHPKYRTHDDTGRELDSYKYPYSCTKTGDNENWAIYGPVQRRGTHNALSATNSVICVGGFRETDGTPALYSSTADGNSTRPSISAREAISVSYPSESGYAHFGLLAAGSRDGSVAAYRGTSMATAFATRNIAEALLGWRKAGADPKTDIGTEKWIRNDAPVSVRDWPRAAVLKAGARRIDMPKSFAESRISRVLKD